MAENKTGTVLGAFIWGVITATLVISAILYFFVWPSRAPVEVAKTQTGSATTTTLPTATPTAMRSFHTFDEIRLPTFELTGDGSVYVIENIDDYRLLSGINQIKHNKWNLVLAWRGGDAGAGSTTVQ